MYQIRKAQQLADKIYLMEVEAPRVARSCQPGEFVIVKIDEAGERIPLTICDYNRENGTVTIVFQIVGASTYRMAALKAGDAFQDFVGPLGRPSEFITDPEEEVKKRKIQIWKENGDLVHEILKKQNSVFPRFNDQTNTHQPLLHRYINVNISH